MTTYTEDFDDVEVNVESIRERIRLGVAYLDEHQPGWRDRVTVADLDLGNVCRCVLGQVFTPVVKDYLDAEHSDTDTTAEYVREQNTSGWRDEYDEASGYFNGYSFVVRDKLEDNHEPDTWVSSSGHTFISSDYAKRLGFDVGPLDSYEELGGEWNSFLAGEWS